MRQRLLEELEALREAHRTARTPDDFQGLRSRMQTIEALLVSAADRSKGEEDALGRVKAVVSDAVQASREGAAQPTDFSAIVFSLMQAVRRVAAGYDR